MTQKTVYKSFDDFWTEHHSTYKQDYENGKAVLFEKVGDNIFALKNYFITTPKNFYVIMMATGTPNLMQVDVPGFDLLDAYSVTKKEGVSDLKKLLFSSCEELLSFLRENHPDCFQSPVKDPTTVKAQALLNEFDFIRKMKTIWLEFSPIIEKTYLEKNVVEQGVKMDKSKNKI